MFLQALRAGPRSLGVVFLVNFFVGLILALIGGSILESIGFTRYVGDLMGVGMVVELGPLLTGVIMTGYIGASLAAEIGTMVVTEETTALKTMALDPARYVVAPRVLATFLSVCVGWVFFRAQTFGDAGTVVTRLAWPTVGLNLHPGHVLLVGLSVLAVFLGHLAGTFLSWRRLERRLPAPALGGALAFLLLLALLLMPEASKGFIYFQF